MNVCFVPFLPPGWLYRILLMKIHQWNSNLKSSLSEFNIKWVTLQSHKLWYWQTDLLRSWINLPIKMHVYCPESNASYAFLWKHIQRAQQNHLIEQILSHRSLFLNIVTTISYPFSPVMNKSLHATHQNLHQWRWPTVSQLLSWCCCWNALLTASLYSHPLLDLHKCSANVDDCQWVNFFPHRKLSCTPLLHTHFHASHHFVRLLFCCLLRGNKNK